MVNSGTEDLRSHGPLAMPALALLLYVCFFLVAFVWRTWVHYRRTGDHGFRGFSGQASPVERVAGALLGVSLLAIFAAPVAELYGLIGAAAVPPWLAVPGLVCAFAGLLLTLAAQGQMGSSWRVGVDPQERTELVVEGLFRVVRNPIFSAMGVFVLGCALLVPNVLSVVGLVCGAFGLELQVRLVEEPFLLRVHGEAYAGYARRVGRFVPGLGRFP